MRKYIQINQTDNVAVAITDLIAGEAIHIAGKKIIIRQHIPAGHKIALHNINKDDLIIKYGAPIGHATENMIAGDWVNEKNIKTNLEGLQTYQFRPQQIPELPPKQDLTFKGYRRSNGEIGIRNEIWVIPTVGCVNGIATRLAHQLQQETQCSGVDAIVAYPHPYGCSQLGEDHENTRKILRDIVLHPNAGGVLVVGLGCENNQIDTFHQYIGTYDPQRIRFIETQKIDDEMQAGMQQLREIYDQASKDQRTDIPVGELRIGLKCGGSDGFSGITANPLLGIFSDFLVAQGGTTVLTEVPEMFGAETILMNRSQSKHIFDKTVQLINNFKSYFIENNQPIYENPSPGNKAGGISTLEEKSLGCTQKAGASAVKDILSYGQRLTVKGLNLLSAPGNDLVASTALAASGCHMILFTTGRGTPFGTFVPTVKIATNPEIYNHKSNWIDFNAGTLLDQTSMDTLSKQFIDFIIHIASGALTNNEHNHYREIAIFKTGVTL